MKALLPLRSHAVSRNTKSARPLHSKLTSHNFSQGSYNPTYTLSPTHFDTLLNSTTHTKNIRHANQIHAQLITNNYTSLPFLLNNLITLYAKCGQINKSLLIFSNSKDDTKNIFTWTTLITQFSHAHKPFKALTHFNQLRRTKLYPNHYTFSVILSACADTAVVVHGEQIHSLIRKHGFEFDIFVGSALINMYAKCSDMDSARCVFDEMSDRNLVTWNAMIVGFSQNELYDEAAGVFRELLKETSISPDQVSFSSVSSACANMGSLAFGRQVHGIVVKHGLIHLAFVKNSLLDMYSKCGCFEDADKLFRTIADRDVVTWNVMAMGWAQNNSFEEACNCFWVMTHEGILPDEASFSTVLFASAGLAALDQGTQIHNQIVKTPFMRNACVRSSLITMYAKCGSLVDARQVFEEIEDQNVVCWTAMIASYQQHGYGDQVIELFDKMLAEGIEPSYITLVCVLSACSHTGRVEEGFKYFNSMNGVHGIKPGSEHYSCMVDMLGRAGRLEEAKSFIESIPFEPDPSVWGALLGACRNHGNLEMGREVADRLFQIEPDNPGNYVLLCNLYTRRGMLAEANEVRRLMGVNGVKKEPGCSWIDFKNRTFVFTVHDKSHSQTDQIYEMLGKLKELVKEKGYVPETQFANNHELEYKEQSLWHHSEKLALAFGLLTLPVGAPIRIKKNLTTCGDCHTVMKLVSQIFNREIIVRDINRFHQFSSGSCSCGDYW